MTGAREERFTVQGVAAVEARLASGSLRLVEGDSDAVVVHVDGPEVERFRIEQRGSAIVLEAMRGEVGRWRSYDVTVRLPASSTLSARLATADLAAEVLLADVEADVASGHVRLDEVTGDVRVKSASGDVRGGRIGGALRLSTASGDVDVVGVRGDVKLHTASGDVRIGTVGGSLAIRTASGDVRIGCYEGTDLSCLSMSGDLEVGVPSGRSLHVDLETLSGSIRNDFEVGPASGERPWTHANVRTRSVSGDVALFRAPQGG